MKKMNLLMLAILSAAWIGSVSAEAKYIRVWNKTHAGGMDKKPRRPVYINIGYEMVGKACLDNFKIPKETTHVDHKLKEGCGDPIFITAVSAEDKPFTVSKDALIAVRMFDKDYYNKTNSTKPILKGKKDLHYVVRSGAGKTLWIEKMDDPGEYKFWDDYDQKKNKWID